VEYFKNPHNFTGDTFDGILTPLLNQITQILNSPNNILGIEYCKALNRLKSSLKPVTLKRQGMGYHDTLTAASSAHAVSADISGKNPPFASASAIRELLTSTLTQETIAQISAQVPDEASAFFVSSLRNNGYLSEEVLDDLLIYRIMYEDAESLSQYLDVSGNLAERIINCRNLRFHTGRFSFENQRTYPDTHSACTASLNLTDTRSSSVGSLFTRTRISQRK